ncbi:MAG TPA: DUF3592 domain-containing protein [Thermoanaerobaculia bacterium]|jgi:hypothetical protein|nr:DUF3592 domain-containing protein [Thermoanaerobaculia bacterium]
MSAFTLRKKGGGEPGAGCMALFFLVFAVVGGGILWFLLVRPMVKVAAARSWPPVPCTVVESRVDESSSDDGTTYKALVNAAYNVDGVDHRSATYDFSGSVYSGGYSGKAEIVARYPVGSQTTCYVNPDDTAEAVISRELSGSYFVGLFGLMFFLPGVIGMFWVLSGGFRSGTSGPPPSVRLDPGAPFGVTNPQGDAAHGAIELKPKATPLRKLIGMIFASLIWNGITWTIAWFAVIRAAEREGCVVVFLAVFALIGLLLIYGTLRQLLVLFNPRPRLTLSPGSLKLGEMAYLQWRLTGATGGARRLQVTLEGKEEVRYRRGTDTHTETKAFATLPVVDSTDSYQMLSGSTSFAVPPDTLPTFASANNKVVWTIKAQLDIANWPDSEEEFEILVRP